MIELRPFASLGGADHGWLKARHHFSFADYRDPERMRWGSVRVWNDDEIAPQSGFPPHPHHDMEIVTYVRTGAISHRDSLGNSGRTEAGQVQVMSAGSGITHAEYNLEDEATDLFQIWILPSEIGGTPRWDMRPFPHGNADGELTCLVNVRLRDDTESKWCDLTVAGGSLRREKYPQRSVNYSSSCAKPRGCMHRSLRSG